MTTMKESTTCGRREMRALYEARQTNVAPVETRVRIVIGGEPPRPVTVRPAGRKTRDHGTAAWSRVFDGLSASAAPRRVRRAMARLIAKPNSDRAGRVSSLAIKREGQSRVKGTR